MGAWTRLRRAPQLHVSRQEMKSILALMISVLLSVSCSSETSYRPPLEEAIAGGVGLKDEKERKRLEAALENNGVRYIVSNNNTVLYRIIDIAAFRSVYRTVVHGEELDPQFYESEVFSNELEKRIFKSKLKEQNIPFEEHITDQGVQHISWSQKYGPQVDHLLQDAAEESYERVSTETK